MRQPTYRKYSRTFEKKNKVTYEPCTHTEMVIDLSMSAAVGIIAFAFVKGVIWGYLLRKKIE